MEIARLKAAREAIGHTKDKLGKLVGIHHSQIGRYEKGDASLSAEVLKKLTNVLDASTDYLMSGTTSDLAAQTYRIKPLSPSLTGWLNFLRKIKKPFPP